MQSAESRGSRGSNRVSSLGHSLENGTVRCDALFLMGLARGRGYQLSELVDEKRRGPRCSRGSKQSGKLARARQRQRQRQRLEEARGG